MSGRDAMGLEPLVTELDYDSYDPAVIFGAPTSRGPLELSAQLQTDAPNNAAGPIPTAPYITLPPPSQLQPPPPTDCQCALSALRECFIEALHWASDVLQHPKRLPWPLSTIPGRAALDLPESFDSHGSAGSPQDQNDAPVDANGLNPTGPYSPPSPPSQLMPPPSDECEYCNRGFLALMEHSRYGKTFRKKGLRTNGFSDAHDLWLGEHAR